MFTRRCYGVLQSSLSLISKAKYLAIDEALPCNSFLFFNLQIEIVGLVLHTEMLMFFEAFTRHFPTSGPPGFFLDVPSLGLVGNGKLDILGGDLTANFGKASTCMIVQ